MSQPNSQGSAGQMQTANDGMLRAISESHALAGAFQQVRQFVDAEVQALAYTGQGGAATYKKAMAEWGQNFNKVITALNNLSSDLSDNVTANAQTEAQNNDSATALANGVLASAPDGLYGF